MSVVYLLQFIDRNDVMYIIKLQWLPLFTTTDVAFDLLFGNTFFDQKVNNTVCKWLNLGIYFSKYLDIFHVLIL